MSEHSFFTMPTYVGGYRMGEAPHTFLFNMTKKPAWLHRVFMRLCLGWVWVDA